MIGQERPLFGSFMVGVENLAAEVASNTVERFSKFENIYPSVQVLLCGMGVGKSTFLQYHREMLVQHCKNEELKALLESDTIEVNITFNSLSSFNKTSEKVIMTSLCRRVILSYFGLPWETKLA